MGRTLILTTPLEQGADVLATQRLMSSLDGSHYHTFFGALDGVYGPETAAAVKHTKYVLGYPLAQVDRVAGDVFRAHMLSLPSAFPEDWQARREFRLHPPPGKTPRQLALARALSQVGYVEQGGADGKSGNITKFGAAYGFNGVSWCAIFQWWAGDPYEPVWDNHAARYAYVPYMLADARAHRFGLAVVDDPIPGDLYLLFWNGLSRPNDSHIGRVISGGRNAWRGVEGNTNSAGSGNGGSVMVHDRSPASAAAHFFVRIA